MFRRKRKVSPSFSRAINKLLALVNRPKHTVDPDDNMLLGLPKILAYLRLKDGRAVHFWVEHFAFPAIKRPDNAQWMTTITAIDHWLFLMAAAEAEKRRETGTLRSEEEYQRLTKYRKAQFRYHAEQRRKARAPEPSDEEEEPSSS